MPTDEGRIGEEVRGLIERARDGRGDVSLVEYKALRLNSWEWEALVPALSDDALEHAVRHTLANASRPRRPCATYDESAVHVYLPEVMRRWKTDQAVLESYERTSMNCPIGCDPQRVPETIKQYDKRSAYPAEFHKIKTSSTYGKQADSSTLDLHALPWADDAAFRFEDGRRIMLKSLVHDVVAQLCGWKGVDDCGNPVLVRLRMRGGEFLYEGCDDGLLDKEWQRLEPPMCPCGRYKNDDGRPVAHTIPCRYLADAAREAREKDAHHASEIMRVWLAKVEDERVRLVHKLEARGVVLYQDTDSVVTRDEAPAAVRCTCRVLAQDEHDIDCPKRSQ